MSRLDKPFFRNSKSENKGKKFSEIEDSFFKKKNTSEKPTETNTDERRDLVYSFYKAQKILWKLLPPEGSNKNVKGQDHGKQKLDNETIDEGIKRLETYDFKNKSIKEIKQSVLRMEKSVFVEEYIYIMYAEDYFKHKSRFFTADNLLKKKFKNYSVAKLEKFVKKLEENPPKNKIKYVPSWEKEKKVDPKKSEKPKKSKFSFIKNIIPSQTKKKKLEEATKPVKKNSLSKSQEKNLRRIVEIYANLYQTSTRDILID